MNKIYLHLLDRETREKISKHIHISFEEQICFYLRLNHSPSRRRADSSITQTL